MSAPMSRDDKITFAVNQAEAAFWTGVAKTFPGADTGGMPDQAANDFIWYCRQAITIWVDRNVPEEAP